MDDCGVLSTLLFLQLAHRHLLTPAPPHFEKLLLYKAGDRDTGLCENSTRVQGRLSHQVVYLAGKCFGLISISHYEETGTYLSHDET